MHVLKFVQAVILLISVDIIVCDAYPFHKNRGKNVNRIVGMNPKLPLLPLFRSINSGTGSNINEEKLFSHDYAPTVPTTSTTAQEDDGAVTNLIALPNVRSMDVPQSGRTLKHLLLLRGLLGSGTDGSSSSGGGGGYTIPYIIINQPMNFTNQNNNSLVNNPPVTTTSTRRRRDVPVRYIPVSNTAASFRPTEVYHQRQSEQGHPQFSIAIPASAATAMFGLSANDLFPMAAAWPNINNPLIPERISHRKTPFNRFANNLKGIQFM